MERKRLPKSLRKFIRREKARIRREVLDLKEQKELFNGLYSKLLKISERVKEKVEQKTGK